MKSLVYLFDRPILPFYNKGTKLSLAIIVLPWLFNVYATASHSSANLEWNLWENKLSKKFREFCEICGRIHSARSSVNSVKSVGGTLMLRRQGYLRYYLRTLTICADLWNLWENIRSKSEICGRIFSAKTSVRSAYSVGDPLLRRRQDTSATMKIGGRIYTESVDSVGRTYAAKGRRLRGIRLPRGGNAITADV